MPTVLSCLTRDHNPWLVLLAAIVCLIGCHVTVRVIGRAHEASHRTSGRKAAHIWSAGAALTFGSAVWSTHFVAMLAYEPAFGASFDVAMTAASLAVAIFGSMIVFIGMLPHRNMHVRSTVAGLSIGTAIFAMHIIGMQALAVPAFIEHDPALLISAWFLGSLAATAALHSVTSSPLRSAALLVLAVCGLHFTAMAAVTIIPFGGPGVAVPSTSLLAIAVAAVALVILLPGLAGVIFDQHLARRSQREATRLRQFADSTFEGILFHCDGIVTDINAAFCAMFGCTPTTVIGGPVIALFAPSSRGNVARALAGTTSDSIEVALLDADGQEHPAELVSRTVDQEEPHDPAHESGVMVVRDLARRKAAEDRIERLARYDTLTGVANRLLFHHILPSALEQADLNGTELALLWIDLDRFKSVNDLLGHRVGDALLVQVASRLSAGLREGDTVARLGGDEFAVLQPFTSRQSAADLSARLCSLISEPFEIDGQRVSIGASIGISLYPHDCDTAARLIKNADLALYRAKQNGRGGWCHFDKIMDQQQQENLLLEQDLRGAIENHALEVHYQPQFGADGVTLVGYEALVRWRHSQRGAVSPAVFIPLAEASGMIVKLGSWVLETACAEAAKWDGDYHIAVNLSPVQLRQDDLADMVAKILRRTGLAPERLELEVTEGVLISDPDHAVATMLALKREGVRIALDDYGTGYSSLHYLRRFPFDKIKIDASYVRNLGDHSADVIIGSIIELGHGLDMIVTAEGVETDAQLLALRRHGCDQIQGFLLGRPVAEDRLHHRMAQPMPRRALVA